VKIKIDGRFEVEIDEDKYLRNSTMFEILLDELFQKTSKQPILNVSPFSMELPESPFRDATAGANPAGDLFAPTRLEREAYRKARNERRANMSPPLPPLPLEPEDDEPSLLRGKRSAKKVVRKTRRRGTV
jgi:hypothetical protein